MNKWTDFRLGTSVFLWARQIVHLKALEAHLKQLEEAKARVAALKERLDGRTAEAIAEDLSAAKKTIAVLTEQGAHLPVIMKGGKFHKNALRA